MKRIISKEKIKILKDINDNNQYEDANIGLIILQSSNEVCNVQNTFIFYKYSDFIFIEALTCCIDPIEKAERYAVIILNNEEDVDKFKTFFQNRIFIDNIPESDYFYTVIEYNEEGYGEMYKATKEEFFDYMKNKLKELKGE